MDWRARIAPTVAAPVTVAAGLGVRAVLDGPVANVAGVALWTVLVAVILVWLRPRMRPRSVLGWSLAIGVGVELLQLTGLPLRLYRIHPLFALVLGTSFQLEDLPGYLLGAALGATLQAIHRRQGRR